MKRIFLIGVATVVVCAVVALLVLASSASIRTSDAPACGSPASA